MTVLFQNHVNKAMIKTLHIPSNKERKQPKIAFLQIRKNLKQIQIMYSFLCQKIRPVEKIEPK